MKIYQDYIIKCESKILRLTKISNRLSVLRLLIFIISCIVIIILIRNKLFTPVLIFFSFSSLLFAFVIKRHDKITWVKKHAIFLKGINESEILRLKCDLEVFDAGQRFVDQNHPYSSDLDIFGQHSLFQLVNRTTTESGTKLLANWLSEPALDGEILDRQKAIKELSQKLDWRQNYQATGMHFLNRKSDYNKLLAWVEASEVLPNQYVIYRVVAITLSILSILVLSYGVINPFPLIIILISILIINYWVLRKVKPLADNIVEMSYNDLKTLKAYQALINEIESQNFKSKKLRHLKSSITVGTYTATKEIKKLLSLLEFSHQRSIEKIPLGGNAFYSIINAFLLLDIYLIIGTEKWKSRNRLSLNSWSEAVSEFEVLNSFAGFYFSNPSFTFPVIKDKPYNIDFKLLGHPLISQDKRVCNNFQLQRQGEIVVVTGSNMSGKSTFLRTIGINIVLAQIGAPCCAKYGQVPNLKVITSMRTQDNLKEGISSFYAELKRIEKMLKLIESNNNIFFLLDEMFKGTNSEDRHKGGFSLINQIRELNTSGIIATHDIELAKLSENKMLVENYSFNSEIIDDSMIFSYELRSGICNDFNASELMKKSGIKIISNI